MIKEQKDNEEEVKEDLRVLIEKSQKKELNYFEEAEEYCRILKKHKLTQVVLAKEIGKSQSTIANKIRLLKLSDRIKKKLIESNLTERHARAMLDLKEEKVQLEVLVKIREKKLNVKKAEGLIFRLVDKYRANEKDSNYKYKIKKERKKVIKDVRIFIQSVQKAIVTMKKSGVKVTAVQMDKGEYIEFVIRVSKKTDILT